MLQGYSAVLDRMPVFPNAGFVMVRGTVLMEATNSLQLAVVRLPILVQNNLIIFMTFHYLKIKQKAQLILSHSAKRMHTERISG